MSGDATPDDPPNVLHEHLRQCQCRPAFIHELRCACLSAKGFIGARLFTTVAILSIVASAIVWIFGSPPLP